MSLIERTDSLLVAVDAQPGFVRSGSRGEADRASAEATFERAVWIATIATLLEIPAIVTEEDPQRNGATEPRLLERLAPDTPILPKVTFALTSAPAIVAAIRASERGTIVLIGYETDVCVAQSAVGLHALGLRTVVIEDATFSNSAAQHEQGLRRMRQAGVELHHCKGIAFEWTHTVQAARETFDAARERYGPAPLDL